jgi:cation transport regulator ChaC
VFKLFAYGSCMNTASLSQTLDCDAQKFFLGPAQLVGWRLVFNYPSTNGTDHFCNIERDPLESVFGALYQLPAAHRYAIRQREAWHKGRYREEVLTAALLDADKPPAPALVYIANVTSEQEGNPGTRYAKLVLDGALGCYLPPSYIAKLEGHIRRLREC